MLINYTYTHTHTHIYKIINTCTDAVREPKILSHTLKIQIFIAFWKVLITILTIIKRVSF